MAAERVVWAGVGVGEGEAALMTEWEGLSRREFLRGATATCWMVLGGEALGADAPAGGPPPAPVRCGVIGTGFQGRALLTTLARLPGAPVAAICDLYEPSLKSAQEIAPQAKSYADYRQMLEAEKDLQAVFIATPSHRHREPALAAVQAGKHVYCEAPLAVTVEEAHALAVAGKDAKSVFQVGLQQRSNPVFSRTSCTRSSSPWTWTSPRASRRRAAPTFIRTARSRTRST
jgi:Oxidoreductase family, NAD-binding Rossmann fold